jgi:hypothetical protein
VVWRTDSKLVWGSRGDVVDAFKAGSMMKPKNDFRVWVAPSTRTEEILTGVWRFPSI